MAWWGCCGGQADSVSWDDLSSLQCCHSSYSSPFSYLFSSSGSLLSPSLFWQQKLTVSAWIMPIFTMPMCSRQKAWNRVPER